jgi:hypothetical protein
LNPWHLLTIEWKADMLPLHQQPELIILKFFWGSVLDLFGLTSVENPFIFADLRLLDESWHNLGIYQLFNVKKLDLIAPVGIGSGLEYSS